MRNQTKYYRLHEFGKALPALRKKIEEDICKHSLSKEKVLATVVSLMERTFIRVGNSEYEKLYGSYGLTTLKDGHVNINGSALKFSSKEKRCLSFCYVKKQTPGAHRESVQGYSRKRTVSILG